MQAQVDLKNTPSIISSFHCHLRAPKALNGEVPIDLGQLYVESLIYKEDVSSSTASVTTDDLTLVLMASTLPMQPVQEPSVLTREHYAVMYKNVAIAMLVAVTIGSSIHTNFTVVMDCMLLDTPPEYTWITGEQVVQGSPKDFTELFKETVLNKGACHLLQVSLDAQKKNIASHASTLVETNKLRALACNTVPAQYGYVGHATYIFTLGEDDAELDYELNVGLASQL